MAVLTNDAGMARYENANITKLNDDVDTNAYNIMHLTVKSDSRLAGQ
jgi:hypothetical protein